MPSQTPERFAMIYDHENSNEALLLRAMRTAAEHRGLLYLIGGCEVSPGGDGNGWLPSPADRVAEDLVAMARLAQDHGLLLDGRVLGAPDAGQLRAILAEQRISQVFRATPGTPGAARSAWSEAIQQAAQSLQLPVVLLDAA